MTELNINEHIGVKLKERRVSLGLSQANIAGNIGITTQQIQKYEKGKNAVSAERLYEFSQILKVPVNYFYDKADNVNQVEVHNEDSAENGLKTVSDRETIEMLKSFKSIKDYAIRKRFADMLRTIALKDI